MFNNQTIDLKVCGITSSNSIITAANNNIKSLGFASNNLLGPNTCDDDLIKNLIEEFNFYGHKKFKLVVLFGLLGDFDSFEYAINLKSFIDKNQDKNLDIFAIAIGSQNVKEKFVGQQIIINLYVILKYHVFVYLVLYIIFQNVFSF